MASWSEFAREQIEEAIKSGKWKDVQKGKRLDLREEAHVPPHLRLGNKILKDAEMVPEWVSSQQELLAMHEKTLRKRDAIWLAGSRLSLAPREKYMAWRGEARAEWEEVMRAFNSSVRAFEYKAPRAASRPPMFLISDELKRFDQFFLPRA